MLIIRHHLSQSFATLIIRSTKKMLFQFLNCLFPVEINFSLVWKNLIKLILGKWQLFVTLHTVGYFPQMRHLLPSSCSCNIKDINFFCPSTCSSCSCYCCGLQGVFQDFFMRKNEIYYAVVSCQTHSKSVRASWAA